ncbi:cupin domain-containing protein [Ameyamaea chiangmaiensis]|nr:cupin domain-containing protein [Ameyamaea chiangmaiensis]
MRTVLFAGTLVIGAPIAAWAAPSTPQTQSGHADVVLKSDHAWNGTAYQHYPVSAPQLTVLKLTIPPHTALPWHIHPFPNAGYVLAGQLTIEDKATGKQQTFHTGEAFAESVNDPHRGVSGDQETVVILTYAGTAGAPTSVPLKGEKTEY